MSAGKVVAHYKQGPNGRVADYNADYLATYGQMDAAEIVRLEISAGLTQDRRDNRDPAAVGLAHLVSRGELMTTTITRVSAGETPPRNRYQDANGDWPVSAA